MCSLRAMSTHSLDSLESCTQALHDVPSLTQLCKLRQRKTEKRCSYAGCPIDEHDNSHLFQTESAASSAADHLISNETQEPGSPSITNSMPHAVHQSPHAALTDDDSDFFVAYEAKALFADTKSASQLAIDTCQLLWGYFLHFILTAWPYTCWIWVVCATLSFDWYLDVVYAEHCTFPGGAHTEGQHLERPCCAVQASQLWEHWSPDIACKPHEWMDQLNGALLRVQWHATRPWCVQLWWPSAPQ